MVHQSSRWLLTIMTLSLMIFIGLFHIHNSDVWWHIAWGEQMLAQHTLFPLAEFFYFTPTSTAYLRELPNTFLGDIGLALLFGRGGIISLQLLVLGCLFSGAYCILGSWKKKLQEAPQWLPLVAFFLVAFCIGTCQLQVVRNSIISLALFPLTLALYLQHTRRGGWKIFIAYIPLFFIWSWIHPSYLLGIISLLLLYGGDLLEKILFHRPLSNSLPTFQALTALTLLFFITLSYSWQPRQLITTPITHAFSSLTHCLKKESPTSKTSGILEKIIQPAWKKGAAPLSGDFIPTWSVIHHPAAWSSLLLALVSWGFLLFYRGPHKIGFIGLLALTTYFGCCYLRGTGYLTIVSIFILTCILTSSKELSPPRFLFRCIALFIFIAVTGIMSLIFSKRTEFFFKEKGRAFGIGKAAVFDDAAYDFAKTHFLDAPCFTTLVTGSYASFFWKKEKNVFIDSFFAPHPNELWKDYSALLETQDDTLLDRYHVSIALIENSRLDWQSFFLSAPTWRPIAIGKGVTLYAKQALVGVDAPIEMLFNLADVESLAPTEQRALAAAYYNGILTLQLHQMSQAAAHTMYHDKALFETLFRYLDSQQQSNIRLTPPSIKPALLMP